MNGHIFLSGGGECEDTAVLDSKYFSRLPNRAEILYIPIALNRDATRYKACYDWFSGCVSKHAKNKNINITMLLQGEDIPELSKFTAIYIGGGNTFKLLTFFINNKLDKKLIKYIDDGGIFYGGSAGAIILGKDINTVKEENDNDYRYSKGLNMVGGLSVICHYQPKLDEKISVSTEEIKTPIIAMPENSGIAIHPNSIEVIGNTFIFLPKKQKLTNSYLEKILNFQSK